MRNIQKHILLVVCIFFAMQHGSFGSLGDDYLDGLTNEGRALVLNNPNANLVYWARQEERNFSELPEHFENATEDEIRAACEALIIEKSSVTNWKGNPFSLYVSYAFGELSAEQVGKLDDIIMSYVQADLKYNPANDILYDTKFFGGDLQLIDRYSTYVLSRLGGNLSLDELNAGHADQVEIVADMVKILSDLDTPDAHALGKNIALDLTSKFSGNDAIAVERTLDEVLSDSPLRPTSEKSVTSVVEEVKGLVKPEAAMEESAAMVIAVEHSEEAAEQSSQWWVWLIGLLVVAGGFALSIRRK